MRGDPAPLDLAVLVVYLAGVTLWGAWLGRGQRAGRDYFLGRRALPWAAVMFSIVATETSTLTFLSIPGVAYVGGLGFLQLTFGYLLGRITIAGVLLPAYYRGELTTAYHLLEGRFGRGARRFTSGIFMLTRLLADSVRLFATAIPVAFVTGWSYPTSIAVIGLLTVVYTYFGGIKAVIWVDAVQMGLYLVGAVAAAAVLQAAVPGGWTAIAGAAGDAGKLALLNFSFDPGNAYTLWAGLLGGAFLSMASHGTDQLIVQRLLTCRELGAARRALVGSGAIVIVQFALFLGLGIGLWAFYGGAPFADSDEIFARFIVEALPTGLSGLLVAGLFAAAMSSLSSSINSLASATAYDFWAPLRGIEQDDDAEGDARTLRAGRAFTILWSALLIGGALAFIPISRGTAAVEVALGIASIVYGGLLGAFALAIFAPAATQRAAVVAIAVGILTVMAVWAFGRGAVAWPWYVFIGTLVTFGIGWAWSAIRGLAAAVAGSPRRP